MRKLSVDGALLLCFSVHCQEGFSLPLHLCIASFSIAGNPQHDSDTEGHVPSCITDELGETGNPYLVPSLELLKAQLPTSICPVAMPVC